MKNNLFFTNKEQKIVLFEEENLNNIIDYFRNNLDSTLLITFRDREGFNIKNYNIDAIQNIPFKNLLIIGQPAYEISLNILLNPVDLWSLDDRYLNLNYNFENSTSLISLHIEWNKKIKNLEVLEALENLTLVGFMPNSKQFEFLNLKNLKTLSLIKSNINELQSITKLSHLTHLSFVLNRNLQLNGNESKMPRVKSLYLEKCKNIGEDIVDLFPNLEYLHIVQCEKIVSLKNILKSLKSLKRLNVYENNLTEVDNRYWEKYFNKFEVFNFRDRKHHLLSNKDLLNNK